MAPHTSKGMGGTTSLAVSLASTIRPPGGRFHALPQFHIPAADLRHILTGLLHDFQLRFRRRRTVFGLQGISASAITIFSGMTCSFSVLNLAWVTCPGMVLPASLKL
jgi:hypothetical protein